MFKIKSIKITGFWGTEVAEAELRDDVNIIIGRNGTGKTTFMNIAHAVLAVDANALLENTFKEVTLKLSDGKKIRTVRAVRKETDSSPFPLIKYTISNRGFETYLIEDQRNIPPSLRRKSIIELQQIKDELSALVSIASLSVYRIGGDPDLDVRERMNRRAYSPVDQRLSNLMQKLTQYELELSSQAREISTSLQREVLASLLYSEQTHSSKSYKLEFDEKEERDNLTTAYKQLGVSGPEITKKIQKHVSAVGTAISDVKSTHKTGDNSNLKKIDFGALDAFNLTRTVVKKSLEAEEKTKETFSQMTLFIETLKEFIPDKTFSFHRGDLFVTSEGPLPIAKLSSGEKQLLILFIEALLQRKKPCVFLADEPELSLHITWQRNIISAICLLNPNAQIVIATHSPEVAGKFKNCLLDMEDILHD